MWLVANRSKKKKEATAAHLKNVNEDMSQYVRDFTSSSRYMKPHER
jgi:hypothetical protein